MTLRQRFCVVFTLTFLTIVPVAAATAQTVPWREELPPAPDETVIVVGDDPLEVELSVSISEQSLGLGYRNGLEAGTGMLFVNESAEPRTFWMKGMRFCIDIIWIEGGEITGAAESVCPDPEGTADAERARYSSEVPVTYVLEVPAGWLAENGYGEGTPVQIPDDLLANDSQGRLGA